MKLILGVSDIPYNEPAPQPRVNQARKGRQRIKRQPSTGTQTTGDVAGWLEKKYHVMETFTDLRENELKEVIDESLIGAMESALMGTPINDPLAPAYGAIEEMFRDFLDSGEIENAGIDGVPTKAAMTGINHRLLHPYAKSNPRRPSFIDSALYQANFRVWTEDESA